MLAIPVGLTAQADEQIDFEIDNGRVIPTEDFAVMVSVLGAAITSRGNDIPVTAEVRLGELVLNPWGDFDSPTAGNVNDHGPTRHYVVQEQFEAEDGVEITVTGRSWLGSGDDDEDYDMHLEANSQDEGWQVKVLRDGDAAPDIDGFEDQASAESFVAPYIDEETGLMTMDENQAIYLFEIGTTRVSSSAADFQDLVVLVTLGESTDDFYEYTDIEALYD